MYFDDFFALTKKDSDCLEKLHATAFSEAERFSLKSFNELLDLSSVGGFGKKNTGFILFQLLPDETEILTLCTHPHQRRTGVASHLLDMTCALSLSLKKSRIILEVSEKNDPAAALYRKAGFVSAGRRKNYYPDQSDALLLTKNLTVKDN